MSLTVLKMKNMCVGHSKSGCRLVADMSCLNLAYRLMNVATQVVVTCDVNVCMY